MDFKPGDVITAQVTKSDVKQPPGLKLEIRHERIYVRKVEGLWKQRSLPVQAGDQVLKIFNEDVEKFGKNAATRLAAIKAQLRTEKVITVMVLRTDPNADDDSTDSESAEDGAGTRGGGYRGNSNNNNNNRRYGGDEYYDDDEEEEEDRPEEEDFFDPDTPLLTNGGDEIRPGSMMKLTGVSSKKRLNGEHVKVLPGVSGKGEFDVELGDGSRLSVRSEKLAALDEGEEASVFWNDDVSVAMSAAGLRNDDPSVASSTRSFMPNLIEAGDMMKIRGLKKKAKMNGTHVEVLGPAEQPGRWEVLIADDPDERVISIAASNLRHIM